jgi:RNA polymerase sigma-70 factor (ECF subfamily)
VRTVYLVVHNHERAEELTQEAFIQLLMHWKKVSRYDRPEAWVRRVAIRLAVRNSRRERLRAVLERTAVVAPAAPDTKADLTEALQQLSGPQRAAVVLHYYEDLPVDQMADILGCSQNTVKSHLHRGRNRLRTLLGEGSGGADVS